MPKKEFTEMQEQMALLSQAGDTEAEIASKLQLSAEALGKEWAELETSLGASTQKESVAIVLARLLAKARAALKVEDAKFAMIVGSSKEQAVLTFSSSGLIVGVSRDSERLLGKSAKELIGQPIDWILTGAAAEIAESTKEMQRAERGATVQSDRSHTRNKGESLIFHHTLVALIGPTGDTAGFVRTIRDLQWRRVHEIKVSELEETISLLI